MASPNSKAVSSARSRSHVAARNPYLDARLIRRAAARSGMGLQYVMKEAHVFDVWHSLSPVIASGKIRQQARIVCKGGTALNKIYLGGLQRFSEDLDFDAFFSTNLGFDRSEKIDFLHENVISAIDSDYTIDRPRVMREVVRFTCAFRNEMGQRDSVFVEFNIHTPFVGKVVTAKATSSILNLPTVSIPAYSFHTLVAKKLKTFYERETGKDIYDIYRSFERCKTSSMKQVVSLLKRALEAEHIGYDDFVSRIDAALSDADRLRRVHASTNPYIPSSLRLDWVKAAREIRDRLLPLL